MTPTLKDDHVAAVPPRSASSLIPSGKGLAKLAGIGATVGQAILWTGLGTVAGVLATPLLGGWLTLNGCLGFALGAALLSVYSRRVG